MIELIVGLVFFISGGTWWYLERKFFKNAIAVKGTVSDYTTETKRGKKGKDVVMYTPVISFYFADQPRKVTGWVSSSEKPEIGKVYELGVNPSNIEDVRIKGEKRIFIYSLLGFGLLWLVIVLLEHL